MAAKLLESGASLEIQVKTPDPMREAREGEGRDSGSPARVIAVAPGWLGAPKIQPPA